MASEHQQDRESTVFNYPLIWFFVAIILFVALLYRHSDLSLLAALVLLLMAGSKAWSLMSLSHVFCSVHLDKERAFPQETVILTTNVENAKFLPVWISIQWPWSSVLGSMDEASIAPQESGLLWYQRARFHRSLKALRRGVYQVGPSHICTSDFFGFFKSKKKLNEIVQIIVYPRLVELKPVDVPKHDLFGTPGVQSPVKDPVYVIGTHDYHPSRPSRHIHWKASARRLRLQEKIFEPSEQGKIMMVLDAGTFEKDFYRLPMPNGVVDISFIVGAAPSEDFMSTCDISTNGCPKIPTTSEWGLISLMLSLMIIGIVGLYTLRVGVKS